MISSVFPLAIHYCYCLRGLADRKGIQRHREAHLSTDNWQAENHSAPTAAWIQCVSDLSAVKIVISYMTELRVGVFCCVFHGRVFTYTVYSIVWWKH